MTFRYDDESMRVFINGVEITAVTGWQAERYDWLRAKEAPTVEGSKIEWVIIDQLDADTRALGFEAPEYDQDAWIVPDYDDGARMLRCGHCGSSTSFNVRDQVDVICEGCGTTYMTSE